MLTGRRLVAAAGVLSVSALASSCAPAPIPLAQPELKAVVSILELMQNIIDPIADNIFNAVGYDITAKGIVETTPKTDDDWAKVMMGAVTLAEGTNLLKIPRRAEPVGFVNPLSGSPNAPELSGEQIQAHIEEDRAKWDRHAEELRALAIEVIEIAKKRDANALFEAGGRLDKACENCHLEYWYPGDKKAVLEDERQRATFETPGQPAKK